MRAWPLVPCLRPATTSIPDEHTRDHPLVPVPSAQLRGQPLRLSGAQPPGGRDLHRREPQPRQVCNFHCVYCQVDRGEPGEKEFVDLPRLPPGIGRHARTGRLRVGSCREPVSRHARAAPPPERHRPERRRRADHLRAISARSSASAREVRRQLRLDDLKLVLITNASMFDRPRGPPGAGGPRRQRRRDLGEARRRHGGVLSPGRPADVPFQQDSRQPAAWRPGRGRSSFNRSSCGFTSSRPRRPSRRPIAAGLARSSAGGGQIKLVQIHTVARPPAESWATPLSRERSTPWPSWSPPHGPARGRVLRQRKLRPPLLEGGFCVTLPG